jgi:hypothetical protein
VLLGYGIAVAALALVLRLHASATAGLTVWFLFALLLGFEAGTLRRFTLERRRYRNLGIVVGDDLELAERRFFDSWISQSTAGPSRGGAPAAWSGAPALTARMPVSSDVLGLFPEPGPAP